METNKVRNNADNKKPNRDEKQGVAKLDEQVEKVRI